MQYMPAAGPPQEPGAKTDDAAQASTPEPQAGALRVFWHYWGLLCLSVDRRHRMRRSRQVTLHCAGNVPPSSDSSCSQLPWEDLAASMSATAASSGSKEEPLVTLVASVVQITYRCLSQLQALEPEAQ